MSADINLSRQRSTSRFAGMAARAQCLLEFNPAVSPEDAALAAGEGGGDESDADAGPESPTSGGGGGRDSGEGGAALTKTSSKLAKEALELKRRSLQNVPVGLRSTFADVKEFVKDDAVPLRPPRRRRPPPTRLRLRNWPPGSDSGDTESETLQLLPHQRHASRGPNTWRFRGAARRSTFHRSRPARRSPRRWRGSGWQR